MIQYNQREGDTLQTERRTKMSYGYYEAHEADWEAMQDYLLEQEAIAQMDADWEASGGHLWD